MLSFKYDSYTNGCIANISNFMPNFMFPLTTDAKSQNANEAYNAVPINGTLLNSDKKELKKVDNGSLSNDFIKEYKSKCKIQTNDKIPLFNC